MARKKKGGEFRDRVVDVLTVDADLIEDHPRNWRTHDEAQLEALRGEMEGVGNVSVLLVVPHPEKPGMYRAVDGHARKKLQAGRRVRVAVLDLDEAEQERVILGYDALGRMAGADQDLLQELLGSSELASSALTSVLEGLAGLVFEDGEGEGTSGGAGGASRGVEEEIIAEKWAVLVDCDDEAQQAEVLSRLRGEGYVCHASSV